MTIIKELGFSLIYLDSLSESEKKFVLDYFRIFDTSISQIDLITSNKIVSVQSLFYGEDISGCSLVNDETSFLKLINLFSSVILRVSDAGVRSAIFGSPNLRNKDSNNFAEIKIINSRYKVLKALARNVNVNLYIEALPSQLCDFCNNHKEVRELDEKIHVDFATMIVNGEDIDFLKKNLNCIERFHLSIPGYAYNFIDYPIIEEWARFLLGHNIYGIIEIQKRLESYDIINEIQCLIKRIKAN